MVWLAVILGGVLAGVLAKMIVPGQEPGGFVFDAVIGIIGGVVGKLLMPVFGLHAQTRDPLWNLFVAVIGAVIILFLYHMLRSREPEDPIT